MSITTTQKIIKIGSSRGITVPAKILRQLDIHDGEEIEFTIRKKTLSVDEAYEKFKAQYGETLKNLADR